MTAFRLSLLVQGGRLAASAGPLRSWPNRHCALGVRLAPVPARAGRPEAGQEL